MLSVATAPTAILAKLHPLWVQPLVLRSVVVPIFAVLTSEDDFVARHRMPPLKGHSAPHTPRWSGALLLRPGLLSCLLLDYFGNDAGTDRAPTLTDRKPKFRIHRDGSD